MLGGLVRDRPVSCPTLARFFLKLAAETVRAVNSMKDKNGVSYARKAMILCGIGFDLYGDRQESQLFPELQMSINNHRAHFDGTPVSKRSRSDRRNCSGQLVIQVTSNFRLAKDEIQTA